MRTVKFSASKKPVTFIMLGVGFSILVSPLIAIYFDPNDSFSFQFHWLAIFPIAIFGFFTYVLISSSLKMFTTYTISDTGIRVYIPPFHARNFAIDDIKEVKLLSEEETRQIIEASILEQNSYSESADIIGYIQMIRKRSPSFKYFTIAPSAKVSTAGPKETITALDVKSSGGSVTLTLKNEEFFFLTPSEPEKFMMIFNGMHPIKS